MKPQHITAVKRRRVFPSSKMLVHIGSKVEPKTNIAVTRLPLPRLFYINAFRNLANQSSEQYDAKWLVKRSDIVDYNDVIVRFTPKAHSGKNIRPITYRSPMCGTIEEILRDTGNVLLRERLDYSDAKAEVFLVPIFKVKGHKLRQFVKVREGDFVEKGQSLARKLGTTLEKNIASPIAGVIKKINYANGTINIERHFENVFIPASYFGVVKRITGHHIEIETSGIPLKGICGMGGESDGILKCKSRGTEGWLSPENINASDSGCILVAGSFVSLETLQKAAEVGVKGIITGGADHKDLSDFLGRDFSVAITGNENIPFPVIITSGFGKCKMSDSLFDLFNEYNGHWTHINGTTHIRAGVIRPEIFIMERKKALSRATF